MENIIGWTLDEFRDIYPEISTRIMWKDGISYSGTADMDLERINVHLENGVIVKYYNG